MGSFKGAERPSEEEGSSGTAPVVWDSRTLLDVEKKASTKLLAGTRGCPPKLAWVTSLASDARALREFSVTFSEAIKNLPLGYRLWNHVQQERSEGRIPVIDPFVRREQPWACHGVPLGGMGACSIGRGFRGDFNRWNFIPGACDSTSVGANQFSVFVRRFTKEGLKKYSSVLYPGRHKDAKDGSAGIGAWKWGLDGSCATYFGLMPRSWTLYEEKPDPELTISCRQVSPFIPHNYQESSLPSSIFVFTLVNNGSQSADVSLLFTLANSIGGASALAGEHRNEAFREDHGVQGVLLHHRSSKVGGPATLAIAAREAEGVSVSVCPQFALTGSKDPGACGVSAADVWQQMEQNGRLSPRPLSEGLSTAPSEGVPSAPNCPIGGAVSAMVTVPPRSTREVAFSLCWDVPIAKFGKSSSYYRRYTQFYGPHGRAAPLLARDALLGYHRWEQALDQWQIPVLSNPKLPEWYRITLFNELYFLVAGGTVWTDGGPRLEERSVADWMRALVPVESVGRSVALVPWPAVSHGRTTQGVGGRGGREGSGGWNGRGKDPESLERRFNGGAPSGEGADSLPASQHAARVNGAHGAPGPTPFGDAMGISWGEGFMDPMGDARVNSSQGGAAYSDRTYHGSTHTQGGSAGGALAAGAAQSGGAGAGGEMGDRPGTGAAGGNEGGVDARMESLRSVNDSFRTVDLEDAATGSRGGGGYADGLPHPQEPFQALHRASSEPSLAPSEGGEGEGEGEGGARGAEEGRPQRLPLSSNSHFSPTIVGGTPGRPPRPIRKGQGGAKPGPILEASETWAKCSGVSLLEEGEENVGQFLYLEGLEYIMWNTYDVHFYASFALLATFPELELSVQRDFAVSTLLEQKRAVKFLADGYSGTSKVRGSVPHDLGVHDPWTHPNAYNIHDTSRWKDLNSKFVLQIYRDIVATGSLSFARAVWPAVEAAISYLEKFDRDGDCLIENDGFPDQTYDNWDVHGVSTYCGGLWLGALRAGAALALLLQKHDVAERWASMCTKGLAAFEQKLWNGRYYNYDSGSGPNSNSIQADQLAGHWACAILCTDGVLADSCLTVVLHMRYLLACNLPGLVDNKKACKALQMIFEYNVMKVGDGYMGAVNGMDPAGNVDEACLQSREVWTGVTYAVAATMIHEGMHAQAFRAAEGIFRAGWQAYGYAFQTPEGWNVSGRYRSLAYMRPLAIWAMQWALKIPSHMPLLKRGKHEVKKQGIAQRVSCTESK